MCSPEKMLRQQRETRRENCLGAGENCLGAGAFLILGSKEMRVRMRDPHREDGAGRWLTHVP